MRTKIAFTLWLLASVLGFGQSPAAATPGEMKDPRAILAAAEPYYDFSDAGLKPFHLKATYQLYDEQGKPTEQGTWEYWHVSEKVYRSSWTRADTTRSEWHTADGAVYVKQSGEKLRYFERVIDRRILDPLPTLSQVDSGKLRLEFENAGPGSHAMQCVKAIEASTKVKKRKDSLPEGTSYCFDPISHALLITAEGLIGSENQHIAMVQNHYFPREVNVFADRVQIFALRVETIDGVEEGDAALTPDRDAVEDKASEVPEYGGIVDPEVIRGKIVKSVWPAYPQIAKLQRVQGVVIVEGTIDKEGRVGDLEVLHSASPLLTKAAVDAVKQWEYSPNLLNGKPVDVDTTINVIFALGR